MLKQPRTAIRKSTLAGSTIVALLVAGSVARVHLRAEATMLGYEIGNLKDQESKLFDERSFLKMELAKLTTRKHLALMAEGSSSGDAPASSAKPKVAFNR